MNTFIYVSTFVFLFGAVTWSKTGWFNTTLKFTLWVMAIIGVVLSLQLLGYLVKAVK